MEFGASNKIIEKAEIDLGLKFSDSHKSVLKISNGLDLPGGWRFLPVFDIDNPRKTASHIVDENINSRWEYMADDLIAIAFGGSGNCLVVNAKNGVMGEDILHWNHETNKTKKWKDYSYIYKKAEDRIKKIEKQRERSLVSKKSKMV